VLASVFLIAIVPALVDFIGLRSEAERFIEIARWPLLALAALLGLAVFYHLAPDRTRPRFRWVTWGAVAATLIWMGGSLLFAFYASNFGNFGKTYGALAGVVVLLLWLYLSAFAILLGAELNGELEAQTAKDSTVRPEKPMGRRGARKADVLGHAT
jgi:membrane protein